MEISKQDVGFDLDQLELASHVVLSEAADQQHIGSKEADKESVNSSDSETSDDDDDDDDSGDDSDSASDSSSSSSDSSVTVESAELTNRKKSDTVNTFSCSEDGKSHPPPTVSDPLSVTEKTAPAAAVSAAAAAATAVEPTELVCKQLSSLTVSDEQQVTAVVTELPQSDPDLQAQR